MNVVYFVHDLNDPAVHRRLEMLSQAGAVVTLLGFRRGAWHAPTVIASQVIDLGTTESGRMVARIRSVLFAALRRRRWEKALHGADMVIARNLECLALAVIGRRGNLMLAYECLDIHRLMLGSGLAGRLLRALEFHLMRRCKTLVVSSPAFVEKYFKTHHKWTPETVLLENRVLASEVPASPTIRIAAGPPWRIGWFGVIRCARSLHLLRDLLLALPGQMEVIIRGRPARDVIPGFDLAVADTPGMSFLGPYDRRYDLSSIYGAVHFTWAMDFYEAGGNSDWLLPNRLYEGGLYEAVALAAASSETGRWLRHRNAGVVLEEPLSRELYTLFSTLDAAAYNSVERRISRTDLVYDATDCRTIFETISGRISDPVQRRSNGGTAEPLG
jgi:succinoglycan biosynthesis protein ExoL